VTLDIDPYQDFIKKTTYMLTLSVSDMTCGHCVKSITEAVHAVAPEALIRCDLALKQVQVDGRFQPKDVQHAIEQAGYHPLVLTNSEGVNSEV
jgi:copper chaperone